MVAVCQIVSGTCVIKRLQAKSVKCVWEGVEPFFLAFFLAARRRVLTTSSGARAAIRRAATCSFVPIKIGCSKTSSSTVARRLANSTEVTRSATTSNSVA